MCEFVDKKNQKTTIPGRDEKKHRLGQRGCVIWLTGLSGSGKSTIAQQLELELAKRGFLTQTFDGDIIRSGINSDLGFSEKDRAENIRRIAEINKLFLKCGIICINSLISPTHAIRKMAYEIIGRDNVIEVFLNASLEACEQRDTKGLYGKARAGLIKDFTGISSPYEPPENPDILLNTEKMTVEECVAACVEAVNKLEAGSSKLEGRKK